MKTRYPLANDTVDNQDIQELIGWLQSKPWLTQGSLVRQFEEDWSHWLGTLYALFVNSGPSANLLMYYAALLSGRLKNRRVIVPAIAWATTVAPAIQLGFEPILCEADWNTFGLDMKSLERLLADHDPGAVIFVHTLGVPDNVGRLLELQSRHGFLLMEDACPAVGAMYEGKFVGTFGDMSTFSLYFGHHLSTLEGGLVCTDDEELQDILVQIRSHGWAKDLEPEKAERAASERGVIDFNKPFTFYHPGFNVRSTDLNARIGLSQMKKLDRVLESRTRNHYVYQKTFQEAEGLHCQSNPKGKICSISFVALANDVEHRERIGRALWDNGVETRPLGGGSIGRQPFWVDRFGLQAFKVADRIHETSFMLPNNPSLEEADIRLICDIVLSVPR